jgi:hypothetical protein
MSLEAWSTIASFATLGVIAATAIAALIQLRNTRSGNQILAVTELDKMLGSERLTRAQRFVAEEVPKLIADPAGRSKLAARPFPPELEPIRDVGNFFELLGLFVKFGIIDRALATDLWDGVVFGRWKQLEPVVMIRRQGDDSGMWANFEYFAVICEKSLARTAGDYYPRGVPRMTIDKRSLEAAEAFAKDRANDAQPPPVSR